MQQHGATRGWVWGSNPRREGVLFPARRSARNVSAVRGLPRQADNLHAVLIVSRRARVGATRALFGVKAAAAPGDVATGTYVCSRNGHYCGGQDLFRRRAGSARYRGCEQTSRGVPVTQGLRASIWGCLWTARVPEFGASLGVEPATTRVPADRGQGRRDGATGARVGGFANPSGAGAVPRTGIPRPVAEGRCARPPF